MKISKNPARKTKFPLAKNKCCWVSWLGKRPSSIFQDTNQTHDSTKGQWQQKCGAYSKMHRIHHSVCRQRYSQFLIPRYIEKIFQTFRRAHRSVASSPSVTYTDYIIGSTVHHLIKFENESWWNRTTSLFRRRCGGVMGIAQGRVACHRIVLYRENVTKKGKARFLCVFNSVPLGFFVGIDCHAASAR